MLSIRAHVSFLGVLLAFGDKKELWSNTSPILDDFLNGNVYSIMSYFKIVCLLIL